MARYAVGTNVARMQVHVRKQGASFEVRATEATEVGPCPEDVVATALADTEVDKPASVSLSQAVSIDYDVVPARRVGVSAVAGIMVPQEPRTMPGVYEMHGIAVVGVASGYGGSPS